MSGAGEDQAPDHSWRTSSEAKAIIVEPALLRRTIVIALVVGTILSVINQIHVVLAGGATSGTWLRVAANYVVPFIVSNVGALAATRRG